MRLLMDTLLSYEEDKQYAFWLHSPVEALPSTEYECEDHFLCKPDLGLISTSLNS